MPLKRLFNCKYETYSDLGTGYAIKAQAAIAPIIEAAVNDGVSLRDLHYIIASEVDCCISEHVMHRNAEIYKAEKAAKKCTTNSE